MIGNIFLTLALLASVFSMAMYYFTYKNYNNTLKLARIGYHLMTILVIAASLLLMHALLTHNYEIKYVFNYSSSDLSTGLLMSTFWAGQEGSFMLWTLLTVIVGLILLEYTSRRGDLEPRVMMVFSLAVTFLLVMVNPLLKSPFNYIWTEPTFIEVAKLNSSILSQSFMSGFFFSDPGSGKDFVKVGPELVAILKANGITLNQFIIEGKGLNPLLQNFWMQIHPPILFIGFAMATVPFAFAFAALIKNEYNEWVKQSLPWMLSASMILGLGIMLGGYWAYGVLGWGGYWGWDPVENSSLVPWIISVAAIHTMLVQKKNQNKGVGRFVKTNLLLAIMTYVLVLYSTFLTRSGILGDSSVHSFVSPGAIVYLFLVLFLGSFTLLGFGAIAYRWKFLNQKFNYEENVFSRELALFTGSIALIASAIIILIGTSAPIFGQSVEIKFYNEANLPIAIIIGIVNGLSLLLKWKHTNGKSLIKNSYFALGAALISTILIVLFGNVTNFMLIVFTLTTAFALWVNVEIAYKIFKGRKSYLGAYVAHFGLALFFLGVIATGGTSESKQVNLAKGETVSALGYDLTFNGYRTIDNGKKYAFDILVKKGNNESIISPVMYVAEFNNSLMREPDIWSKFTKDFYIAPVGYNSGEESHSEGDGHNHGTSTRMVKGDSFEALGAKITFNTFELGDGSSEAMMNGGAIKVGAVLNVVVNGKSYDVKPYLEILNGERTYQPALIESENLKFELTSVEASSGSINLQVSNINGTNNESTVAEKEVKETLTIDASIKPFINLVWLGTLIMVIGYIISAFRRTKESQS